MTSADLPSRLRALVDRGASLVEPPRAVDRGLAAVDLAEVCAAALAAPAGRPALDTLASPRSRVVVIISDATRDEPRGPMFHAVRDALSVVPDAKIEIVVASGTHAPRPPHGLVDDATLARHRVHVHDGADASGAFDLGVTSRGTRVRINRVVAGADLVVVMGRLRPHYFAGYSGGAKGVFPGCALSVDARQNHLFKADPSARLGRVDDNVCRLDLEEATSLLGERVFLLNVLADRDGVYLAARAGDVVLAHRALCRVAGPVFTADGPPARVVVTSDRPPVTDSLYQASKLLPPAGPLLDAGGTVVVVADCAEGTGPLATVNEGIYRLGVRHHLPEPHAVRLVSAMPDELARATYATPAADLDAALCDAGFGPNDPLVGVDVLWRAGELITRRAGAAIASLP